MAGEYFGEHSLRTLVQLIKAMGDSHVAIKDVINNLQDESTDKPLSAAQGKILHDLLVAIDPDGDGVVDNAKTLDGLTKDDFAKPEDIEAVIETLKNAVNGIAGLDDKGKIPASLLPASTQNVVSGYLVSNEVDGDITLKFYADEAHEHEIIGEANVIYIDITSEDGSLYKFYGGKFISASSDLKEISDDDIVRIWNEIEV